MSVYALALLTTQRGGGWPPPPPEFLGAFLSATSLVSRRLETCSCQGLANIAWGVATLLLRSGDSPSLRPDRDGGSRIGAGGGGGGGERCQWDPAAIVGARPSAAEWVEGFASASGACMGLFSDQELAVVAWSLGQLRLHPGGLWMGRLGVRCVGGGWSGWVAPFAWCLTVDPAKLEAENYCILKSHI